MLQSSYNRRPATVGTYTFVLTIFVLYLLCSGVVAVIGGYTYSSVLRDDRQLAVLIVYALASVPVLIDLDTQRDHWVANGRR